MYCVSPPSASSLGDETIYGHAFCARSSYGFAPKIQNDNFTEVSNLNRIASLVSTRHGTESLFLTRCTNDPVNIRPGDPLPCLRESTVFGHDW
jgi:hypothetical protein